MHFNSLFQTALAALSFFTAVTADKHIDYAARNLKTISTIYNLTVFPHNIPIITGGAAAVPKGLFNQNATGRVAPLGNFSGFEHSIEYFFALALVPSPPTYSVFSSAKIVSFSSECAEVAASIVYLETRVFNPNGTNHGQYLSTLKQVAFWRFDSKGAVLYYDAFVPNLADWNFLAQGQVDFANPYVQAGTIQQLCPVIQNTCTGVNTQYNSTDACVASLSSKTFGNYNEVWGDNVVCRTVHLILASVNPKVHCPHVGPSGGGKCVNEPYNEGYFDDNALFGQPSGKTFTCPKKVGY